MERAFASGLAESDSWLPPDVMATGPRGAA